MMIEKSWEHFSHEADVGLRGVGPTLSDAFEMGALALIQVICDVNTINPKKSLRIHCDAPNKDILFVDWLNKIIYTMGIHKMLFSEFHVTLKNQSLEAIIKGEPIDRNRHQPVVEVKGATYTELKVYKQENGWVAQCVVDV